MCRYDATVTPVRVWAHKIQSYTPTANTLRGNSKTNFKYRNWRTVWEKEFGEWLQSIPPAQKYRRVIVTRYFGKGKRAFDRVNFAAGCKPLLDTIVNFGALYDDSELWAEDHYLQLRSSDGLDYIEIRIEEFE